MQANGSHNIKEYISLFSQGDEKGLAFFFHEFYSALSLFANNLVQDRFLAEEVVSDAFMKIWKFHHKLDSYTGIRAYLYKIVKRDCYRIVMKEEKRKTAIRQLPTPLLDEKTAFHQIVQAETFRLLHTAIQKLSPGNKKVIEMHYLQEKTTGEIASELNLTTSTIHTQKTRALQALQKILVKPLMLISFLF